MKVKAAWHLEYFLLSIVHFAIFSNDFGEEPEIFQHLLSSDDVKVNMIEIPFIWKLSNEEHLNGDPKENANISFPYCWERIWIEMLCCIYWAGLSEQNNIQGSFFFFE